MTEQIGKVTLDLSFYPGEDFYCDGTVEDEILDIVKTAGLCFIIFLPKGRILYHGFPWIRIPRCLRWEAAWAPLLVSWRKRQAA